MRKLFERLICDQAGAVIRSESPLLPALRQGNTTRGDLDSWRQRWLRNERNTDTRVVATLQVF